MNIPCVVQNIKYAVGSPNLSIFASLLKPIAIDHTYVINFEPDTKPNPDVLSIITNINS